MGETIWHHRLKGMHWWVRLGPPYPLSEQAKGVNRLVRDLQDISYKDFTTLMSSDMVEKLKRGSCHDQVNYEVSRLREIGITPKINFLMEADKNNHGGTTHSFVSFELEGATYWLENAWGGMEGLHKYPDQEQLIKDVTRRWDRKPEYPILYSGSIDSAKLRTGMTLQEIIDAVDFD